MILKQMPYNRSEFYSYRDNHSFAMESPILDVDACADFIIEDLTLFPYVNDENITIAISAAALDIIPYRFFTHVHLCRILYESLELSMIEDDFVIKVGKLTPAAEDIKKIIDFAGNKNLFRKEILDKYFDLFNLSLG